MSSSAAPPGDIPRLDLGPVDSLQAELLRLVDEMTREADGERQQALVRRIAECSTRLQQVCTALEQEARASARELRGTIEVVLTAEQRAEIRRKTGVDLPSVHLIDRGGGLVAAMPQMEREQIFVQALEEAEARAREESARRAAEAELERISSELRRDTPEQIRSEIERLLADPEFQRALSPKR